MILSFNGSSPFLSLTLSLFSYESFEEENLFLRERDEKDFDISTNFSEKEYFTHSFYVLFLQKNMDGEVKKCFFFIIP